MDTLARQLRATVRQEFFGPLSQSAGERVKDVRAATARHTTRDPMVLGKPLSSITGSILTNVPLPARIRGVAGDIEPENDENRRMWHASSSSGLEEVDKGDRGNDRDGERSVVLW